MQTGTDAPERGFKVTIVAGACATIDPELEQQTALRYAADVAGIRVAASLDQL